MLKVAGSASSVNEPAGYTVTNPVVYCARCISCGTKHGDGQPCPDTARKRCWVELGKQVEALLKS